LRLYDQLSLAEANYYLGHLSAARAELADLELAFARHDRSAKAALDFKPEMLVGTLGVIGCVATLQGDSAGVRHALDRLRRLPTRFGTAEFQQARIMAAGGNRDAMMRLLTASFSHGSDGGDLMPIEFIPYRDYPPFRAVMFPSN
jgi:hypothetical protein